MRAIQILLMSLAAFLSMTQRVFSDEVLIFSAKWCSHCQVLKADLAKQPEIMDGYEWGYVDADTEKELAKKYAVRSLPTIVVLDDTNTEVKRQVGYRGAEALKKWLNETKPAGYGVKHDSKTIHYVGGVVLGRKYRSRWDD